MHLCNYNILLNYNIQYNYNMKNKRIKIDSETDNKNSVDIDNDTILKEKEGKKQLLIKKQIAILEEAAKEKGYIDLTPYLNPEEWNNWHLRKSQQFNIEDMLYLPKPGQT